MVNPYYVPTGTPGTGTAGNSAPMRSEFQLIAGGFDRFPNFSTAVPGAPVIINALGNGLTTAQNVIYGNGMIGLGTTPTVPLDIVKNQNGTSTIRLLNNDPGPLACADIVIVNGTSGGELVHTGVNYVQQGPYDRPDSTYLLTDGMGGLSFVSAKNNSPILFHVGSSLANSFERMRLEARGTVGGQLKIAGTSGANASMLSLSSMGFWTWNLIGDGATLGVFSDSFPLMKFGGSSASATGEYVRVDAENGSYFNSCISLLKDFNPKILWYDRNYGFPWSIRVATQGTPNNGEWVLRYESGGLDAITVTRNGFVGINNTGPSCILHMVHPVDGMALCNLVNWNAGTSSRVGYQLSTATWSTNWVITSQAYSQTDAYDMNQCTYFATNSSNGLNIVETNTAPIRFFTNIAGTIAERMRVASDGKIGIGNTFPTYALDVDNGGLVGSKLFRFTGSGITPLYGYSDTSGSGISNTDPYTVGCMLYFQSNDMFFFTNGVNRGVLDHNGNMGLGTTGPGDWRLNIYHPRNAGIGMIVTNDDGGSSAYATVRLSNGPDINLMYITGTGYGGSPLEPARAAAYFTNAPGGMVLRSGTVAAPIIFSVNNVSSGIFSSLGRFKATSTGSYLYPNGPTHEFVQNSPEGWDSLTISVHGSEPYCSFWRFRDFDPNDSARYFLRCYVDPGGVDKFRMWSNGGLYNWQANNGNYSDASIKTNITPYSDLELNAFEGAFKAVDWCKFKYKDQTHDDWNYGYTAQGIAAAFLNSAPGLVDETDWSVRDEIVGQKVKVVFTHDLENIAHALLARALKRISELEARLHG